MIKVSATKLSKNFQRYLELLEVVREIIITKRGKEVAKLVSSLPSKTPNTESLIGVLKNDVDLDEIREERAKKHFN